MTLSFYRSLLSEFMLIEHNAVDTENFTNIKDVGYVEYETYDRKPGKLPFCIDFMAEGYGAWLILTNDDMPVIVMSVKTFKESSLQRLMASIAHELGHYLCGHLDNFDPGRQLDIRTERLITLSDLAAADGAGDKELVAYYRACLFSLLRGGILVTEKEADTVAALYAPVDSLILTHAEDLVDHKNPFVWYEKRNRINFLHRLLPNENTNKLHLDLVIRKEKPKPLKKLDDNQTTTLLEERVS